MQRFIHTYMQIEVDILTRTQAHTYKDFLKKGSNTNINIMKQTAIHSYKHKLATIYKEQRNT